MQAIWHSALKGFPSEGGEGERTQDDLPRGKVPDFQDSMRRVLLRQAREIIESMGGAVSPTEAVDFAVQAASDPKWVQAITAAAKPFIEEAVTLGGEAGMMRLPTSIGFDVTNPEVQRFVDNYTARLASEVQDFTRIAARDLLGDGLAKGETAAMAEANTAPLRRSALSMSPICWACSAKSSWCLAYRLLSQTVALSGSRSSALRYDAMGHWPKQYCYARRAIPPSTRP